MLNSLEMPSSMLWLMNCSCKVKVATVKWTVIRSCLHACDGQIQKTLASWDREALTTDIAMVIQPPPSIPAQSVGAYFVGYLLRKIPINDCRECLDELILPELPPDFSDLSEFIRNKTYQEEGCLIYPSIRMVTFVSTL